MQLTNLQVYLIGMNVLGMIAYVINMLLYKWMNGKQINVIINILSCIGGAFGVVLAMLLFDRKAEKRNMMIRVVAYCMLIIQLLILVSMKYGFQDDLQLNIIAYFQQHRFFLYFLVMMNIVTFILFGWDKWSAIKGKYRIPIVTLLLLSAFGGSIGGLLGMYGFRHKTRKEYFRIGMPLIFITQIVLLFVMMNM